MCNLLESRRMLEDILEDMLAMATGLRQKILLVQTTRNASVPPLWRYASMRVRQNCILQRQSYSMFYLTERCLSLLLSKYPRLKTLF